MKYILKLFVLLLIANATACKDVPERIRIVPDEGGEKIDILYDGKLFTSYLYSAELEKPVLFPIYTANGTVITRGFPREPRPQERTDHPHHVGLWFNFGDVNGLDFWNNSYRVPSEKQARYGSIRHREIIGISEGNTESTLTVEAGWVDYTGNLLLKEQTDFIFSGEGEWRMIERRSRLSALQDTVTFTDHKEGLIAIRMDRAFEDVNGIYRNNNGFEKGDVWGKPAHWVSLSAEKEGEKITVAILDHKQNPGYPAHSHARGYGLFATNNMGSRAFDQEAPLFTLTLNPGESVAFRHLIIVKTDGFATDEELNHLFTKFNGF